MLKRVFDIVLSLLLLVFSLPLLVVVAILIKLESPGPVFYRGRRLGLHANPFYMLKFRTMVENAESLGGVTTSKGDARITRVGAVLRRFKLDELPQLINVLLGTMSLVGPRPHIEKEVDILSEDEAIVLDVKPGITDYSSIKYSNEGEIVDPYDDPHEAYLRLIRPGKVWLQMKYAREHSIFVDLKILFLTARTVLAPIFGFSKPEIHLPPFVEGRDPALELEVKRYEAISRRVRERVLKLTYERPSAHLGSCFSCIDILTALYFCALRHSPEMIRDPNRDRFVLSKGHACLALYATLFERGFLPEEVLDGYGVNGGTLEHHSKRAPQWGIETSSGSLGHGLSLAAGMAKAAKLDSLSYRTFVLLSDGELDEGSTWEAALFSAQQSLDNLVAIVDCNGMQALGATSEILNLEPLADKWRAFGWSAVEVDGHSFEEIIPALDRIPRHDGKPTAVIARTVKGKGVSFMEGELLWHYRTPDENEYRMALGELNGTNGRGG